MQTVYKIFVFWVFDLNWAVLVLELGVNSQQRKETAKRTGGHRTQPTRFSLLPLPVCPASSSSLSPHPDLARDAGRPRHLPEASRRPSPAPSSCRADERRLGPPPLLDARCGRRRRLQQRQVPPPFAPQGAARLRLPSRSKPPLFSSKNRIFFSP